MPGEISRSYDGPADGPVSLPAWAFRQPEPTRTVRDVNGKDHDLSRHDPHASGIDHGDVVRLGDGRVVEVSGVRHREAGVYVLYHQDGVTIPGPGVAAYAGTMRKGKGDVAEVLIRKPRHI